jgi:hypothetical protein
MLRPGVWAERIPSIKSRKQRSHEAPKWVFFNHPGGLTAVRFRPFCGSPTLSTVIEGGAIPMQDQSRRKPMALIAGAAC